MIGNVKFSVNFRVDLKQNWASGFRRKNKVFGLEDNIRGAMWEDALKENDDTTLAILVRQVDVLSPLFP